jgi:hypothetical protein
MGVIAPLTVQEANLAPSIFTALHTLEGSGPTARLPSGDFITPKPSSCSKLAPILDVQSHFTIYQELFGAVPRELIEEKR